jgi:hypothetical protein
VWLFEQVAEPVAVKQARSVRKLVVEFGLSRVGWLVDPVERQTLGEHIDCGLLAGDGDERFVYFAAAGHRDVQVPNIGRPVQDGDRRVHGATLRAHPSRCVRKLNMLSHIRDGKGHCSVLPGRSDSAVGMDRVDGPRRAVADHLTAIGHQTPIVRPRGNLVTGEQRVDTGGGVRPGGVEIAVADAVKLGSVVQAFNGLVRRAINNTLCPPWRWAAQRLIAARSICTLVPPCRRPCSL